MPPTTGNQPVPTIHIEPSDSPSPSPLPTHVRPHNTRNSSYSSNASSRSRRPHPQQHEYVPSGEPGTAGLGERWQFEQAENDAESSGSERDDSESLGEEEEEPAWDNLRDGSVSRRPVWRRPSPGWIYPILVGVALSLGMGIAPKSEIYVNLACLAVAPRQSEDTSLAWKAFDTSPPQIIDSSPWLGEIDGGMSINTTVPPTSPAYHPSPAMDRHRELPGHLRLSQAQSRQNLANPITTSLSLPHLDRDHLITKSTLGLVNTIPKSRLPLRNCSCVCH
jgi:hypothetical protein